MEAVFEDRVDAGRRLAAKLMHYAGQPDVLVLALPRGGLPVAYEVATALGAPLDLLLVRKLGVPDQPELAMGAVATGNTRVLNEDIVRLLHIERQSIERITQRERAELLRRQQAYRGERPEPVLAGRTLILIDDGLATGATMRVAVAAVRQQRPHKVVVAVPVAPPETASLMSAEADELVCLMTPEPFRAVGQWYIQFDQTSDEEVRQILDRAWQKQHSAS
jgi:predicted phosphoribosyltransferase